MNSFSKANARPKDKNVFNFSLAKALKDLEPRWKKLEVLEPYQLPWEGLRRNPIFIKCSQKQEQDWQDNFNKNLTRLRVEMCVCKGYTEHEFYSMLNGDVEFWKKMGFWRFCICDKKVFDFGLSGWLRPEEEMASPLWWSDKLNAKFSSDARVKSAFCKEDGMLNLQLFENEKVFIINPDMPYQVSEKYLRDLYKGMSKEKVPQIQTAKLIKYLKVYDFRMWGIQNLSDYADSSEDGDSCISWNMIGRYLFPNEEFSVQRVKGQYRAAFRNWTRSLSSIRATILAIHAACWPGMGKISNM